MATHIVRCPHEDCGQRFEHHGDLSETTVCPFCGRQQSPHLDEAPLVGGPQDGAKVKAVGGRLPAVIHVGREWMGDGFAAWTSGGPGKRLSVRYELAGGVYQFRRAAP